MTKEQNNESLISNIDVLVQGRHSIYKPTGMSNIQYRCTCTRLTFTVQTNGNVQYRCTCIQGWHSLYKPMGMSNIDVHVYKVDIHCTNQRECPISNIDAHVQGRHSLYKPMGLFNIKISKKQHWHSLYKHFVNIQWILCLYYSVVVWYTIKR